MNWILFWENYLIAVEFWLIQCILLLKAQVVPGIIWGTFTRVGHNFIISARLRLPVRLLQRASCLSLLCKLNKWKVLLCSVQMVLIDSLYRRLTSSCENPELLSKRGYSSSSNHEGKVKYWWLIFFLNAWKILNYIRSIPIGSRSSIGFSVWVSHEIVIRHRDWHVIFFFLKVKKKTVAGRKGVFTGKPSEFIKKKYACIQIILGE